MPGVFIKRTWPDGDAILVSVRADSSYPDALDEARAAAVRGYREVLDISVTETEE